MKNERSYIEIDLIQYEKNIAELRKFIPAHTSIMQIVKADAYGHGAVQIARTAQRLGIHYLGVANVEEGIVLRTNNITLPILILSPSLLHEIPKIIENSLIPTVSSFPFLQQFEKKLKQLNRKNYPIHINVDTGMKRAGVSEEILQDMLSFIQSTKSILLEGVYSHFSSSEQNPFSVASQKKSFYEILSRHNCHPKHIHISNSYGLLQADYSKETMVRIGILSFGICLRKEHNPNVKPLMTFSSKISFLGILEKGKSIGYKETFIAPKKMRYAIVPIGYADGYDFLLSNKGMAKVKQTCCPIIGQISMDMIALDVTKVPHLKLEEDVHFIGKDAEIRPENIVAKYNGSPYELLCQVGRRAKRFYIKKDKLVESQPLSRREFLPQDFTKNQLSNVIQDAIETRMKGKEISLVLYAQFLHQFFEDYDREIAYREHFYHRISIKKELENYYEIETELSFEKTLENESFFIACANNPEHLEQFFQDKSVEYRWLLDASILPNEKTFQVTNVSIEEMSIISDKAVSKQNNMHRKAPTRKASLVLETKIKMKENCLLLRCSHTKLKKYVGKKVKFQINTKTLYAKSHSQLTIYIAEITKGICIDFIPNNVLKQIDIVPIFSGKCFPTVQKMKNCYRIAVDKNTWVFPNSGVVFAYKN